MSVHRNYSRPMPRTVAPGAAPGPAAAAYAVADDDDVLYNPNILPRYAKSFVPRARSLPRQEFDSQDAESRPSSSGSSATHVHSFDPSIRYQNRESLISQDSTTTSVYPQSISTVSGPETPPSPMSPSQSLLVDKVPSPAIDTNDISSRLRLLSVNNYFLPPAHAKPTPQELSPATSSSPHAKSPIVRDFFRLKSPITPSERIHPFPSTPSPPQPPPVARGPRLMVIREQLPNLDIIARNQHGSGMGQDLARLSYDMPVDPTSAVDIELPQPTVRPREAETSVHQDPRLKGLLETAVGLSFAAPRRSFSPSASGPPAVATLGRPIASPGVSSRTPSRPHIERRSRSHTQPEATLPPPPRLPRSKAPKPHSEHNSPRFGHRNDNADNGLNVMDQPPALRVHPANNSTVDIGNDLEGLLNDDSGLAVEESGGLVGKVSWDGGFHGAHSLSPRPSVGIDRQHTTPSPSHEGEEEASVYPVRPSMTEWSTPRESVSSRAPSTHSYQSTTFGTAHRSKKNFFGRSRSTSPTRASNASKRGRSQSKPRSGKEETKDVIGSPSESEGQATVIYVQPWSRAVSSAAVSGAKPTKVFLPEDSPISQLDPRRGITNAPPSPSPSLFTGLKWDRKSISSTAHSIVGSESVITVRSMSPVPPEPKERSIESWRTGQANEEEARRLEGMLVQHMEQEKERIRKIAYGRHTQS